MTAAQAAVVNEALERIASQQTITDLNDGSPLGNAAGVIYTPIVNMMLRRLDPDFARTRVVLFTATNGPVPPWAFEYAYPTDCLRTRQVQPNLTAAGFDPNDPQPVRWQVAFDEVGSPPFPQKVILSNQAGAGLIYTTSLATETFWDSMFREAIVGQLAEPLAMAAAGRPDFAQALFQMAEQIASIAEGRDDGV